MLTPLPTDAVTTRPAAPGAVRSGTVPDPASDQPQLAAPVDGTTGSGPA